MHIIRVSKVAQVSGFKLRFVVALVAGLRCAGGGGGGAWMGGGSN